MTLSEINTDYERELKLGDSSRNVYALQYYLAYISLFYPTVSSPVTDGDFGQGTDDAVRSYQKTFGLNVNGVVEITLRPLSYTLVGVESSFDLMKTDFGEYGEVNKAWSADDVKGFTKIMANPLKIYYNKQKANNK